MATSSSRLSSFARIMLANLLLLIYVHGAVVYAAPTPMSASESVHEQLFPRPGGTPQQEIECYGLPYGGLGFFSHILTYYTAAMHIAGRRPLLPWTELTAKPTAIITCLFSVILSVMLSAFMMSSCRNDWQFTVIAFWKLTLSFSLNAVAFINALNSKEKVRDVPVSMFGTIFYWFGSVIGIIGVFDFVHRTCGDRNVKIITGIFIVLIGISF